MPTVLDPQVHVVRFKDSKRYMIDPSYGGIHKFIHDTPIFRVQRICEPSWLRGICKIIDAEVGVIDDSYLDFLDADLYIFLCDGRPSVTSLPDLLRTISDLPEGSEWSYYPAMNPNEVTACPTSQFA